MPWLHACVASWACFHGFRPAGGKTSIQCWSEHQGEGSCDPRRLGWPIKLQDYLIVGYCWHIWIFNCWILFNCSHSFVQLKLNFEKVGLLSAVLVGVAILRFLSPLFFKGHFLSSKEVWKSNFQQYGEMKKQSAGRRVRREKIRRKKMQVREKVGKSQNTVFSRSFVAPEG